MQYYLPTMPHGLLTVENQTSTFAQSFKCLTWSPTGWQHQNHECLTHVFMLC